MPKNQIHFSTEALFLTSSMSAFLRFAESERGLFCALKKPLSPAKARRVLGINARTPSAIFLAIDFERLFCNIFYREF